MRATVLAGKRARELRRRLSLPEQILWTLLRGRRAGLRFRRQHPFGPYILDFYAPSVRLAVEVDGSGHEGPEAVRYDARRDAYLAREGVRVLRFPASMVLDDEGCEHLVRVIAEFAGEGPPPLAGEGDRGAVEGAGANGEGSGEGE